MRHLDRYRCQQMGLKGHGDIQIGNRAAHRGRALADAILYQTGKRADTDVFEDIYGVDPFYLLKLKHIEDFVTACGFHGSLKYEKLMKSGFENAFTEFLDEVKQAGSPEKVEAGFKKGSSLLSLHYASLEYIYDKTRNDKPASTLVTAPNSPGQQAASYQQAQAAGQHQQQQRRQAPTSGPSSNYSQGKNSKQSHSGGGSGSRSRSAFSKPSPDDVPEHLRGINQRLVGTKPCSFYAQGRCAKGDKCTFRHD